MSQLRQKFGKAVFSQAQNNAARSGNAAALATARCK